MAETILNSQTILKTLEETKAALETTRPKFLETQAAPSGFEAEVERRLAGREISPQLRAQEREIISQLFTSPRVAEQRLLEAGVEPTRVGGIVGSSINTYLEQLDDIKQRRKERRESIGDIVKSARAGLEAEAKIAELEFKTLQDKRDFAFSQLKEANDEIARRNQNKVLGGLAGLDRVNKNQLRTKFFELYDKEKAEQEKAGRLKTWDGKLKPDDYINFLRETKDLTGSSDWFIKDFNPVSYVSAEHADKLNQVGVDYFGQIRSLGDDEIISDLRMIISEGGEEELITTLKLIKDSGKAIEKDTKLGKRIFNIVSQYLSDQQKKEIFGDGAGVRLEDLDIMKGSGGQLLGEVKSILEQRELK